MRPRIRKALSIWAGLLIALAIGAFCASLAVFFPNNRLDSLVYDQLMRLRGVTPVHPGLAIVEIDEKSLQEFGQWPWPRYLLADLVQKLLADGALAVGLDMLLSEPDRTSPQYLDQRMRERYGTGIDLEKLPREVLDHDVYFGELLRGKPVVLGAYASYHDGEMPAEMPKATGIAEKTPPGAPQPRDTVPISQGLLLPLKVFSDSVPIGIINASFYDDGIIRAVPLIVRAGDNLYASLSLRTLMLALKRKTMLLESDPDGLASIRLGKYRAPVQRDGMFRPVFHGPSRTFPYISAVDVLTGKAAAEVRGRIIFIGSSATGLLDQRATPFDHAMPGVEFHATIVDNILTGLAVIIPHWTTGLQIVACFFTAFLFTAIFGLLPLYAYAPLAVTAISIFLWGSWRFFENGLFVSPVYVLLTALLAGAVIISLRFWREQRAKKQIKRAFSRYVAPEAVARIAENGTRALEGEQKEISILFTDVRNFTTISGRMQPDQVVRLLNSYFTPMTACVIARQGTMDKFVGDAMMAFWNAPLDVQNHQQKALLAALDMQRKLAELRPQFQQRFGAEIRMGVGIHSGTARVGNMGSLDLLDYTCIGDNVNLASRLEGLCKQYGAEIVVSKAIVDEVRDIKFRQLDRVRVKGSDKALAIYAPLDPELELAEDAEAQWQKALETYFAGDFALAMHFFAMIQGRQQMAVAAAMFIERCRRLKDAPPENWDGVYTYTTK